MTLLNTTPTELLSATIPGSEHLRLNRNNQDGLAAWRGRHGVVAVVTDGCSQGRHSEVGAQLGARFLAAAIGRRLSPGQDPTDARWIASWSNALLRWLGSMSQVLAIDAQEREGVVADYLLFTFLVAIVTPRRTAIIGVGDGAWSVGDETIFIDSGPKNAPPYLAYALVDALRGELGAELRPRVHFCAESRDIDSLLIATDGLRDLQRYAARPMRDGLPAGGISELLRRARRSKNPSLLQKRLRAIAEQAGPLRDDLTMALLSQREGAPCA